MVIEYRMGRHDDEVSGCEGSRSLWGILPVALHVGILTWPQIRSRTSGDSLDCHGSTEGIG